MIYVEVVNGVCNGNSSSCYQPTWNCLEIESLPDKDLRFYRVIDNALVYDSELENQFNENAYKDSRIEELELFLSSTDWYAIRFADTGEIIPEEIKQKRQNARNEISELRNNINLN